MNNKSTDRKIRRANTTTRIKYGYARLYARFENTIETLCTIAETAAGIASVSCLISMIVYLGYDLNSQDRYAINNILHLAQLIFTFNILSQLIFRFRVMSKGNRIVKWIVDAGVLISVIAWAFPHFDHPWFPILDKIFLNKKYFFIAMGAYSLVDICYALSRIPSRRTNPSLLMALSFLLFIVIGSFVLMLPKCTYNGISYFDSLFVASSAVCITGLTPVDFSSTFTPLGILVVSVLIQLGSLGILTFTSFFAIFFTGRSSIYNQLLLRDMVYSKSMNSLIPTLLYVLGFTLSIEIIGAVCVYLSIPDSLCMGLNDKLIFAGFHSLSSFCNAGFCTLHDGMSNTALMKSNQSIYIITSVLIFAGAVGFPILVNVKEILFTYVKRLWRWTKYLLTGRKTITTLPLHLFDLNTKIVLYTTLSVLAFGTASFFVLEYNNTLSGMSLYEKSVQSIFNSLTPRSAGFASVNPGAFLDVTLLLVMIQMVIGGASQSMAGGIKVNTLGTIMLNLRSVLYGHTATTAFKRTLNAASVRRANAVLAIAMISLIGYTVVIMLLNPEIPVKSTIFEVVSALFTVGSSLGATALLDDVSKVILSTAMFFGRVGIISFLCGVIGSKRDVSAHLPIDNVIIN